MAAVNASRFLKYLGLGVLLCHAFGMGHALAIDPKGPAEIAGYPEDMYAFDSRELAMLPKYCKFTYSFKEARVAGSESQEEYDRWAQIMGDVFKHMHHYCFALMNTNRALLIAKAPQWKTFYLGRSITEFDYVLHRAPPDFALLPEIYTKKGENLIRLGRYRLGVTELNRAIEIKPDYWPPYAALGDYYKTAGDYAAAREILEKGLEAAPDTSALKRRLSELQSAKLKGKP
jgi:tetratricopeptide (TPR) repeat protein